MTRGRLELVLGAALAGLTVLLAVTSLAGSDGDAWVWLAVLALTPVLFVAPYLLLDLPRGGGSERALERAASPLVGACFALSFFALAIVVGAGVSGLIGGVVGGVAGIVLALQGISARRRIRSAVGLEEKNVRDSNQLAMVGVTALSLAAMTALLAGLGYLLFGRIGAIVMGILQGVLLLSMVVTVGVVGLQRRGRDA